MEVAVDNNTQAAAGNIQEEVGNTQAAAVLHKPGAGERNTVLPAVRQPLRPECRHRVLRRHQDQDRTHVLAPISVAQQPRLPIAGGCIDTKRKFSSA